MPAPDAESLIPQAIRREDAMMGEQPPLPVAMRADELSDQDFETLYKRALEIRTEQPDTPRKIPMGKSVAVTAGL